MRSNKYLLVMFISLFLIMGCSVDYDKETIEKAEATARSYLENNYTDIKSVEIEKIYRGEMGGMMVEGTVNNQYGFSMSISESSFTVGSIGGEKGFPDRKEECKDKSCDY